MAVDISHEMNQQPSKEQEVFAHVSSKAS